MIVRNRLASAWIGAVLCCVAALTAIELTGPTLHDEALTLLELAGQAASPWPTSVALVSTLKKDKFQSEASLHKVVAELNINDSHPPLYYVLLWIVSRVTGVGWLFGYRLFSVAIGAAALYLLARWTKSLLCFTLFALSPLWVIFATLARDYMLAILLILATACLLDTDFRIPRWARYAAGLCGAMAVWTHYLAVFPIGILLAWTLLLHWKRGRGEALWAIVLFVAASAPALWAAFTQMHTATHTVFRGLFTEVYGTVRSCLRVPVDPLLQLPMLWDNLASAIVAYSLLAVMITFRQRPRRAQLAFVLVACQAVILVFLSVASHQDLTAPRYMGLLLPFYCVLVAEAVSGADVLRRSGMVLFIVLAVAASCFNAAISLQENRLRNATLATGASSELTIVGKAESPSPGIAGAILNDLPDESSFFVIQSDESLRQAIGWNPSIYRNAFFCATGQPVAPSVLHDTLRGHFAANALRFFREYDCYPWAGGSTP